MRTFSVDPRRLFFPALLALLSTCTPTMVLADASSASLVVSVTDTSGALISDAQLVIRSSDTNREQQAKSGKSGSATFSFLKPGHYKLTVSKASFADVVVDNIVLNVGDERRLQLMLKVGSSEQAVNVDGSGSTINTTDASVSTVIDRKFVENIPLNGRSFQGLILLTPGTTTNSPQHSSSLGAYGEFSVNGQRTESNYYTVDGVSANAGVQLGTVGSGASGSVPAATALGTTQALVSVDALQEFRVEASTYSAEYGRNPGGQFSMVTRSGTNDWHGSAFDYLRNDALDANSWFNDNTVPVTRKTPERQNDFGGTLGGPIQIPRLYDGRKRSFFFFSYEGLRLTQPVAATVNQVSNLALRQSVSGPLQQVLNAFPLPSQGAPDLGNGLGEFIAGWSNPSRSDATSVRFDHNIGDRVHLFFRFSDTPSNVLSRGTSAGYSTPSNITASDYLFRTYTAGATTHLSRGIDNDLRANLTTNAATSNQYLDNFGGAVLADLAALQGINAIGSATTIGFSFSAYDPQVTQAQGAASRQKIWNVVDTLNIERGRHSLRLGIDWRRLSPTIAVISPNADYIYDTSAHVTSNSVYAGAGVTGSSYYPLYQNFSAFGQDSWRLCQRLTLSMGIRWDINPAPSVSKGLRPYTVTNFGNLSAMSLAAQGTPLWNTSWYNLAPRLGAAYVLNSNPDRQAVLRGGGGVFFDSGQQTGSYGFNGPGFQAQNYFGSAYGSAASFPVPVAQLSPAITNPPTAPYAYIYANPPHFQLPYTLQWNLSLEQALGRSQSITVSGVGANGRKLIEETYSNIHAYNPSFNYFFVFKNGLTSSYNALELKYQRQVARGLQALASYTWAHALDYGTNNIGFPYQRGNSDLDVRHNFTGAVSYDLPHTNRSKSLNLLSSGWGLDGRVTTRTGFPVTLNGSSFVQPGTLATVYGGLNLVPGVPLFLYESRATYPGGRRINPAAFSRPATGTYGNAPRNFITGFGAVQTDVAIRRSFPIHDKLYGQFRLEAFNLLNHPNFGAINATYGNVQFGQATAILSQSLGTLSPLYQMGGPRSLQATLHLTF